MTPATAVSNGAPSTAGGGGDGDGGPVTIAVRDFKPAGRSDNALSDEPGAEEDRESPTVERGVSGAVDGGSRAVREEWITHRVIVNPRPPADIALFRLPARYAHVSHIAAGTFGIVVAATDLDTGKKVAIKKMFEP